MALTPGTRLGPYEVLAPLGEGGMGTVYRGQRFLMIKQDAAPNGPLVVVEHFFDELERLAPHAKR